MDEKLIWLKPKSCGDFSNLQLKLERIHILERIDLENPFEIPAVNRNVALAYSSTNYNHNRALAKLKSPEEADIPVSEYSFE